MNLELDITEESVRTELENKAREYGFNLEIYEDDTWGICAKLQNRDDCIEVSDIASCSLDLKPTIKVFLSRLLNNLNGNDDLYLFNENFADNVMEFVKEIKGNSVTLINVDGLTVVRDTFMCKYCGEMVNIEHVKSMTINYCPLCGSKY